MDQKENFIDQDITLTVVLPGGVEKSATVHGSKPMMDLLVVLCGKYHLNPSSHTIELLSTNGNQIKFKPNALIGELEAEKVILKPKGMNEKKKKSAPVLPEATVRLVINYKKTQKTILRVSPQVPLQHLIPAVSEKCEFDPKRIVLLKEGQSREPLDLTKSLNDLGLREVYALDTGVNMTQTSSEILKEQEHKGFFNIFRRSKKKNEQAVSAPASPTLIQRPGMRTSQSVRAHTYSSSTLPSDMPKKRRAPLPPMIVSQSMPQDLSNVQTNTQPASRPEREKDFTGISRQASSESSLRSTKRKAPPPPAPPCKMAQEQPLQETHNKGRVHEVAQEQPLQETHNKGRVHEVAQEQPLQETHNKGRVHEVAQEQPLQETHNKEVGSVTCKSEETCTATASEEPVKEQQVTASCIAVPAYESSKECDTEKTNNFEKIQDPKMNSAVTKSVKMIDTAIQASAEMDIKDPAHKETNEEVQGQSVIKTHFITSEEQVHASTGTDINFTTQEGWTQDMSTKKLNPTENKCNSPQTYEETADCQTKSPVVYKRDTEPKPKPSNEATRDYIPKIGMTTYKIVPQKSLEKLKFYEVEVTLEVQDKTRNLETLTPLTDSKAEIPQYSNVQSASDSDETWSHNTGGTVQPNEMAAKNDYVVNNNEAAISVHNAAQVNVKEAAGTSNDGQPLSPPETHYQPPPLSGVKEKKTPPATRPKPGSFRLPQQKRTPGYYVTSAAGKHGIGCTSPGPNETPQSPANEKDTTPDKTIETVEETSFPPPPPIDLSEISVEKVKEEGGAAVVSRPLSYPNKGSAGLSFLKYRSFAAPKPYPSTSPSPFALAVSSAVKRSQFSRGSSLKAHTSQELPSASFLQSSTTKEMKESSKVLKESSIAICSSVQGNDCQERQEENQVKLQVQAQSCTSLGNGIPAPVIKVYNEDDTSRALEVPSDITARDVCQLFILKNHCIDDHSWTLFEHRALIGIERTIEDHESIIEVQSSWGMETDDRLYFRKNYAKYEFFKKPLDFFPEHMVSISSETNGILNHSQLVQEPRHLQFVAEFSDSDVYTLLAGRKKYGAPTDYGFCIKHNQSGGARGLKLLCADEEQIRTCWVTAIRLFKRSISENSLVAMDFSGHKSRVIENPTEALSVAVEEGLSWREPRHLQFVAEFSDSDVYTLLAGRKKYGAPTDYGFCIKHNQSGGARGLKLLCADEEQIRTCWVTAIRLFKRSISENSLVAMDFSGHKSRVIENPTEALSVAVEEGLSWRRKSCLRLNPHGGPSTQSPTSNLVIHRTHPWFHHKISRDEAHKLIAQQGLIDGVFLLRDSQSNPKTFVLSLCHAQKIKHFQIVPLEEDGELFFTLDDGHTRFTDLIQLVEFYQLNKGVLPCKLKHHCARIAL
ncbi:Growth factor receptor-bound protein 14 [Acipenser ruthenus]|uniref:Growth factor receptor-bound protein 14 n=1 Tax=Acipenser ruthenus TaxID=7906 RepID=A0A444TYV5_ACIRT|nr:Growth factor receptor-bound protein 14 [Acipenser ruthenus]